jgi:hypothetical protein
MVDEELTHAFPEYCANLRRAMDGHVGLQKMLLERGRAADEHLGGMLISAARMAEIFDEVEKTYRPEELRLFRSTRQTPPSFLRKTGKNIMELCESI